MNKRIRKKHLKREIFSLIDKADFDAASMELVTHNSWTDEKLAFDITLHRVDEPTACLLLKMFKRRYNVPLSRYKIINLEELSYGSKISSTDY